MKTITITNLNDGISVKSDPSAILEGALVDCIGFDLTEEGVLKTSRGLATNDISTYLPAGTIQCIQIAYIGSTRYILATTSTGLYANAALISTGFTGRFKALSFINDIYLINGTYAKRFNGTTCYQWGITAPTNIPQISMGNYLSAKLDDFEVLTNWTANQVSCVISAETTIKKEGAQSAHFAVAASTRGYSFNNYSVDGTLFDTGETSVEQDYVYFWLYVDSLVNLDEIAIFLDVGDGTFKTDYFSYSIVSPRTEQGLQTLGFGRTADVIAEETVSEPAIKSGVGGAAGKLYDETYATVGVGYSTQEETKTITRTITKTAVDPVLLDQALSFWRRSTLFQLKAGAWQEIKIPKSLFVQTGTGLRNWTSICKIKIEIATTSSGAVNVYFDDLKIVGGTDLVGDYWFMYAWGNQDAYGNILHESSPARNNAIKQLIISGPINFDKQPLVYDIRTPSTDAQVNCCILYALGGGLTDFWEIGVIDNNTAVSGTLTDIGEKQAKRKLTTLHNEPSPAGTDMALFKNKIWMIGDSNYTKVLRSSDILIDGTIAPSAFPTRNAYEMAENVGDLTNINVLNKQLVIKGIFGEWVIGVNDPTDYLEVTSNKVSSMGLMGQDAVIALETSHVYPSSRGFVESNGAEAKFILPELEPLIGGNISDAIGLNTGLVSYFSYNSDFHGRRLAKVDLYRGKLRLSNIIANTVDSMIYEPLGDKVYIVKDGGVYILESGYTDTSTPGLEMLAYLKSKVYRPGGKVAWTRIEFSYNTGGIWYILELYIDENLVFSFPFNSTIRTVGNFPFGPVPGYDFQFIIGGSYNTLGTIYFPMRIYHSG